MINVLQADEGGTFVFTETFNDEAGVAIPLTNISSIVMTYYTADEAQAAVNARTAQNVLNANNCTYHATSGLFTWNGQAADTKIINSELTTELHRALIVLTRTNGAVKPCEVEIRIPNLQKRAVT